MLSKESIRSLRFKTGSLHTFIAVLAVLFIVRCAMAPGARLVPKGTLEIGGQTSMIAGNLNGPGFPIVPTFPK